MKISYIVKKGTKSLCEDTAIIGKSAVVCGTGTVEACLPVWIGAADGVGGNPGGSLASAYVASHIMNIIPESAEQLKSSVQELNTGLLEYGRSLGLPSMASAFTGCYIGNDKSFLVHAGNTRLWSFSKGYIRQLSKDMTTYQRLSDMLGRETAEGCNRSEIYCCFGGNHSLIESVECREIFEKKPSALLFTSDGIHDYIDTDIIENVLNEPGEYSEKLKKLSDLAAEAGSRDDMTGIFVWNIV